MKEIKTGNMYEKLQKELDKGNAVLVEVDLFGTSTRRYRLVTPKNCQYVDDHLNIDGKFYKSCFVQNKKDIVRDMQVYDRINSHFIIKMLVL